ncbi:histidine kinase [Streptomyces sp. NBC_00654]|uniref:sensor histidine kinase n=1 Tax=Streptomyces sp. NBC_00654 TaxID=2975799 RepID=UPI0022521762|nr:histidine kinase [Streptomyces sp. NBC_00654]MCX4965170.1 histidine kinase [Streptomyces sp. NBC_00654]
MRRPHRRCSLRRSVRPSFLRRTGLWLVLCAPVVMSAVVLGSGHRAEAAVAVPLLGAAVGVSRRWPLAASSVPVLLGLWSGTGSLAPVYWGALAVFVFLAGSRPSAARPAPLSLAGAVLPVAGVLACACLTREPWDRPAAVLGRVSLELLVLLLLPWLLGRHRRRYTELISTGRRVAGLVASERRAVADRTRIAEQARIAGDMHDSLGHELTLLAVRAAALELNPALGPGGRAAAGELREAAAAATGRLREIVGVLGTEDRPAAGESLGALVEGARACGVAVSYAPSGEESADRITEGLPRTTALAVHRVVQGGLTNAVKHAPGAAVRVELARSGGRVGVAVVNEASRSGALPGVASGATGLVGLGERVRLAGGTLVSGPTPRGGFRVVAELPAESPAGPAANSGAGTGTGTVAVAVAGSWSDAVPEPAPSAVELERAGRQVRRLLALTVRAPLAVVAGALVLVVPASVAGSSFAVLDGGRYTRLTVGEPHADVSERLPAMTRGEPPSGAGEAPAGADCVYYSTAPMSSDAYRLCFTGGRLSSKAVVGPSS